MLQEFSFIGPRNIDAQGDFITYLDQAAGLYTAARSNQRIIVQADGDRLGSMLPGDSFELPRTATRWTIEPQQKDLQGVVQIGMGRRTSTRPGGATPVVIEDVRRTLAGLQQLMTGRADAPANFVPAFGIRAAPDSGPAAITKLHVKSNVNQFIYLFKSAGLFNNPGANPPYVSNKLIGNFFGNTGLPIPFNVQALVGFPPPGAEFSLNWMNDALGKPAPVFLVGVFPISEANRYIEFPLSSPIVIQSESVWGMFGTSADSVLDFVANVEVLQA